METGILYFYTATALKWHPLFFSRKNKDIIISSLVYLSSKQMIIVYGLVIMPNYIHMLIEIPCSVKHPNKVQHSFMSYTAHEFKKALNGEELLKYLVNAKDRKFQFWERNPKIIPISDFNMAGDIINYMHCNPLQSKWNLVISPEQYDYSSACFYDSSTNDFGVLRHYMDYFNRKVVL